MSRPADVLEVLLPKADPATAERARRVTTFLRLLAADARPALAGRVRVDLKRARSVFERESDRSCTALLLDLLRQHLDVAVGSESFCWTGSARVGVPEAWSALELLRDEWPWLPHVPGPGERALAVCARLLAGLGRFDAHAAEAPLWRARLTRAAEGPGAGEASFRELLEGLKPSDPRGPAALAGLIECELDAGAVRRARVDLEHHAHRVGAHPRLQRLRAWVDLLCDGPPAEPGEPGESGAPAAPAARALATVGPMPRALAELRERRTDWLACLPGAVCPDLPAASGDPAVPDLSGPPAATEAPTRGALGAVFLGVLALEPGGDLRVLHADLAPSLEARLPRWLEDRDGACSQASEPEHRLVVEARAVISHQCEGQPLRGALAPEGARALVLEPILDEAGEVAGWLHLELEHHLVPTKRRLRQAATAWGDRLLPPTRLPLSAPAPLELSTPGAPEAEAFRAAIASLGLKLTQRRWWGFVVRAGQTRLVASGGAGLSEPAGPGRGRAVERALRCGGLVRFDEPDARLSLHGQAASGVCMPLSCRGRLSGVLALESSRRRDFGSGLADRLAEQSQRLGTEVRTAEFRAWHAALFGHDVHFEPSGFVDELVLVGRARAPVAIHGPGGCGKRIVARWVHFESDRWRGPLISHACGLEEGSEFPGPDLLELAADGTLVLHDVERLSEANQVRLDAYLARPQAADSACSGSPRVIVTSGAPLAESVRAGVLRAGLCRRLERLTIAVPPLSEQRDQIPGLVAQLVERFAQEEGVPEPRLDDGALACLWRQPWPGNVRQLENVVFKLVITAAGGGVGARGAEAVLQASMGECLRRVPSRRPERRIVACALRATRTGRGSLNKTRASLYLGWDPDTLVLRMAELGLDGESLGG